MLVKKETGQNAGHGLGEQTMAMDGVQAGDDVADRGLDPHLQRRSPPLAAAGADLRQERGT